MNNEKKYDCKFLARCNNKYCNFNHPSKWDPIKNHLNDWNGCYQINPSVMPYALEFGIEIFQTNVYWNQLKNVTKISDFNKVIQSFFSDKEFVDGSDNEFEEVKYLKKIDDIYEKYTSLKDIINSKDINRWCEDIIWAMVIEMNVLNDSCMGQRPMDASGKDSTAMGVNGGTPPCGIKWIKSPIEYIPLKYRPAKSYYYINKNSINKSNICKNGEYGYRCYKVLCMCIHNNDHSFREAFEKFYIKYRKPYVQTINITHGGVPRSAPSRELRSRPEGELCSGTLTPKHGGVPPFQAQSYALRTLTPKHGGVPPLTPIAVESLPDASIHELCSCPKGGRWPIMESLPDASIHELYSCPKGGRWPILVSIILHGRVLFSIIILLFILDNLYTNFR